MAAGYSRGNRWIFSKNLTPNNKKANTVVHYFSNAVTTYGLPDKVRSDKGGENCDVWHYSLYYHNMEPSYVVVGSSTHNVHIERLWGNVFRCVGQIFMRCFMVWKTKDC